MAKFFETSSTSQSLFLLWDGNLSANGKVMPHIYTVSTWYKLKDSIGRKIKQVLLEKYYEINIIIKETLYSKKITWRMWYFGNLRLVFHMTKHYNCAAPHGFFKNKDK